MSLAGLHELLPKPEWLENKERIDHLQERVMQCVEEADWNTAEKLLDMLVLVESRPHTDPAQEPPYEMTGDPEADPIALFETIRKGV